jgi:DNA primase
MKGRIPENILEDILSRVDIVEVVSGFIPLKRAGRNFKTTCPFHHEKTPSFMVSPERQIYHCFGCGESGNAFKFLMQYERMEFREAVETLARKSGVILPEQTVEEQKTEGLSSQLYSVAEAASAFYENNLNASAQGKAAREYLQKRGIAQETARAFKLGFASREWDALITHLRAKGFSLTLMEKAGLILAKDAGGYYDRFRNRVIFPIVDVKSRVMGFGARVLDDSLPKYINSPETAIYTKGRNLFGLNLAKESIRESDFVAVVEGYLDFIVPYQHGMKNIVASCGTALTLEQIRLLKRYTHNVVMVYDADAAGEIATLRSLDMLIEEEMDVKVAPLPKGVDPDLFVRKFGVDDFKKNTAEAQGLFEYKLQVLKTRYNYKNIEDKARISGAMLETIGKLKNAVLKSEYIKRLSQDLEISEEALLQEAGKVKGVKSLTPAAAVKKGSHINPTEKLLVKLMLEENELIQHIKESLHPADFQDERISRIVSMMFDLTEQGRSIEPNALMNHFNEEDISQVLCESVFLPEDLSGQDKEKMINDCILRLKSEKLKNKRHELHNRIAAAQGLGDDKEVYSLMQEFHDLIKKG